MYDGDRPAHDPFRKHAIFNPERAVLSQCSFINFAGVPPVDHSVQPNRENRLAERDPFTVNPTRLEIKLTTSSGPRSFPRG